jgi:membrane protease subunit (stomatin/prohibitin family)
MALIDRIKFDCVDDEVLVWKFPSEDLTLGAQLIVNQSQEAVFLKSGEVVDIFGPGTHTLTSGNLPILSKIVNFPFGGASPFTAEVWFVNKTAKRNLKWGTSAPIQLIDPLYNFPISVRAFGQWGIRLENSRSFVAQLVGTRRIADSAQVEEYFSGEILQRLSDALAKYLVERGIPVLQIASKLNDLSGFVLNDISSEFYRFGIEIVNFNIERVSIPPEEQKRLQDVLAKRFEMEQLSQLHVGQGYIAAKTFETLDKAAGNEGVAGSLLAGGLGVGMGLGGGLAAGQQMAQSLKVDAMPKTINSDDDLVSKLAKLKSVLDAGLISQEEFDNKKKELLSQL